MQTLLVNKAKEGIRYSSVQKSHHDEASQKQFKREVRREANFTESTTVRNHQTVATKMKLQNKNDLVSEAYFKQVNIPNNVRTSMLQNNKASSNFLL